MRAFCIVPSRIMVEVTFFFLKVYCFSRLYYICRKNSSSCQQRTIPTLLMKSCCDC